MNKRLRGLQLRVLLGSLALFALGCTANKQPSKIETALANMAKDVVIPMEAKNLKNPLPANDEIIQQGREIFVQSCAICHGADGHAVTGLGRAMYPPAMDLTSPHVQNWTDAELFWIIQNGIRLTGMPSWKATISEEDTWKLVHFTHNLPRLNSAAAAPAAKKAEPSQPATDLVAYGKILYRQEGCFMCHQLNGEGGKVGPDLTVEGARGRTDDWLVGHFKDPPAFTRGSLMPPYNNLTDEQLRALTTFLQSLKGASGH
jgi:mono/diheme cytochrome c family protein